MVIKNYIKEWVQVCSNDKLCRCRHKNQLGR